MAASLHSKGRSPLIVWNRTQSRIDDFLKLCAEGKDGKPVPVAVAKSAREVAERECRFLKRWKVREVVSWNLTELTSIPFFLPFLFLPGCDVVITSIGSDHALEEIFVELFAGQQSKKALPDSA